MFERARAVIVVAALLALASAQAGTQPPHARAITTPEQQFGAAVGDDYFLATYAQLESYWKQLDRESDRMALVDIGRTEEGRTQWMAIVTAPENFARLDRYREISRRLAYAEGLTDSEARALSAEGKAVVWIDGGLHATEVLTAQQLIETAYQLVSATDAETTRLLRNVIVLLVHANPDGHELVANWYMRERNPLARTLAGIPRLYQKYAGHDNNRDFYMGTQAETINMNRVLFQEWVPQIVYDHHQAEVDNAVMVASPFGGPSNDLFDPLVHRGIDAVGASMRRRFAAEGKVGVATGRGTPYSNWWNGGLRTTSYFHNQIGILTETIGSPAPPPTGLWRFRFDQAIEYSVTANRAVLEIAARDRAEWLFNIYQMGRNSIERGSRDPLTYILPADQPDFLTATKFVNALLGNGITVHRAIADFQAAGRAYPAGSYVVKTAQAFRPHVLDMFEPQDHPDDVPDEGHVPRGPYDSAGWTLAFQMGVQVDRVRNRFDGPFERLVGPASPGPGAVVAPHGAAGYVVSQHQNDAVIAVNRLLKAGQNVFWLRHRAAGGSRPGAAIYSPATPGAVAVVERAAKELGLTFTGVMTPPADAALQLRRVRIGLVDRHGGWSTSGWIRWLLERYEFPFDVVYPPTLDRGDLASRYDVLILPSEAAPGHGEMTHRQTLPALRRFVEEGGTLLAIGRAAVVGKHLGLPVSEPLSALPASMFFVPGSVLRVAVDNTVPLGYGFGREVDVFFDSSPVFRLDTGALENNARPVAWFASAAPLRSGWARGQAHLRGTVAVVDAPLGRGRVVLFGPEITFRAQSHGTFKFLFNGIHHAKATPARLR
ncbi:MAG: M14 family zinc carboxypeptidase [Vicinamibacterales bacterium]